MAINVKIWKKTEKKPFVMPIGISALLFQKQEKSNSEYSNEILQFYCACKKTHINNIPYF